MGWRERLTSTDAWSDVAHNFRGDWKMLWKEITIGFLLAGFIGLLGDDFFNGLFIENAPPVLTAIENVLVGPLIAVLSFVCSVGNIPLAAVLWSGGISFAGVMAFIFADLIVIPIILAYRKYYGTSFALRITALMFVTMVIAALVVDGLFSAAGLIPTGPRPTRDDIFGSVELDYKLVLNLIGLAIFVGALLADRPTRRHRPGLRDEGRPGQGDRRRAGEPDRLLLLGRLPRSVLLGATERLADQLDIVTVGEQSGGCRRVEPAELVDLVVGLEIAAQRAHQPVADQLRAPLAIAVGD